MDCRQWTTSHFERLAPKNSIYWTINCSIYRFYNKKKCRSYRMRYLRVATKHQCLGGCCCLTLYATRKNTLNVSLLLHLIWVILLNYLHQLHTCGDVQGFWDHHHFVWPAGQIWFWTNSGHCWELQECRCFECEDERKTHCIRECKNPSISVV